MTSTMLKSTLGFTCCVALASFAQAQGQGRLLGSIDWRNHSIGQLDGHGQSLISEGDLLTPVGNGFGPMPRMGVARQANSLGLPNAGGSYGHGPATGPGVEVDAISSGNEIPMRVAGPAGAGSRLYYSVDKRSVGNGTHGHGLNHRLRGEAQANEGGSDIFTPIAQLVGPVGPGGTPPSSVLVFDGDGIPGAGGGTARGLGLREPNIPGVIDTGDDLDALNLTPIDPSEKLFFSLDGAIVDPFTGLAGSNSAQTLGVSPAAVLRRQGSSLAVYATPAQLGLDRAGFGTDDLDALMLWDNGDGIYTPSQSPNDWIDANGQIVGDMLLFSVRRGSRVIGQPDSLFGLPIEAGDILMAPVGGGTEPAIYLAAETLDLSTTRTGSFADDLDAIAITPQSYYDCNKNGIEDGVDITTGASLDTNNNQIPDECEDEYSKTCFCSAASSPCGNADPAAGCRNSLGVGASLDPSGSTSVAMDDLVLTASNMPPNAMTMLFIGSRGNPQAFGDGLRCMTNSVQVTMPNANAAGVMAMGPGLGALACTVNGAGCFEVGATKRFQVWYRNSVDFCTPSTSNLTNAVDVIFTP